MQPKHDAARGVRSTLGTTAARSLELPVIADLVGPVEIRLKRASDPVCWGAVFAAPFVRHDDQTFVEHSD